MGPLGYPEMMFIFVLALLLFGPKKLPELGKTIGKALTEFNRAKNDLKTTFDREMRTIERETDSIKEATNSLYHDTYNYDYSSYNAGSPASMVAESLTLEATTTPGASVPQGAELTPAAIPVTGPEGTIANNSHEFAPVAVHQAPVAHEGNGSAAELPLKS